MEEDKEMQLCGIAGGVDKMRGEAREGGGMKRGGIRGERGRKWTGMNGGGELVFDDEEGTC